jgi:hypothetical protein
VSERILNRLCAAAGIAYVVLGVLGVVVASVGGKTHNLTVGSTRSEIMSAVGSPAGTGVWVGAYIEMLSMILLLAFAVWASVRLGGGVLGSIMRGAAIASVGAGVVSLAIGDTISYRAGHGLGVDTATVLVTLNEAVYVGTWFLNVALLLSAGALALSSARRVLGWSALAIAAYTLVGAAVSFDNAGQFGVLMMMAWVIGASIALARGETRQGRAAALARTAHQAG